MKPPSRIWGASLVLGLALVGGATCSVRVVAQQPAANVDSAAVSAALKIVGEHVRQINDSPDSNGIMVVFGGELDHLRSSAGRIVAGALGRHSDWYRSLSDALGCMRTGDTVSSHDCRAPRGRPAVEVTIVALRPHTYWVLFTTTLPPAPGKLEPQTSGTVTFRMIRTKQEGFVRQGPFGGLVP